MQDDVNIVFSDNGKGMSNEILTNIYEPFYTTLRNKGGTGLGMNIVYNIVHQQLKGEIEVKSSLDKGTTTTIKLPIDIETVILQK